jgi:hypothetical protein
MRALLSFCNESRTPDKGVLLFDFATKTGTWFAVGTRSEIMGTRGIAADGKWLYVCYTVGWWETHVSTYALAEQFELAADYVLGEVKDPHSMCVHDGRLLVASTGTDEIIAYDVEEGAIDDAPVTFWRAGRSAEDTHHVNSVASDGNRVVISAFGRKSGEFWSSAENGYIRDVTSDTILREGLRQPHSVRLTADRVYFTESSRQTLCEAGGLSIPIGGYVRRCDVVRENSLLVGSNAARRVSRSLGIVTNSNNIEEREGEVVGKCTVAHVKVQAVPAREFYDVTPYGKEIYDICALR